MAAGTGIAAIGSQAQAQTTIIQDNFTSGSHYGATIDQQTGNSTGLAPTTDIAVPAQKWQHINGAFYDASEYSNSGSNSNYFFAQNNAQFHNNASAGLSLGTYNTGGLTLSANIGFNNSGGPIGQYYNYNPQTNTNSGPYTNLTLAYALAGFSSSLNTGSNYGPDSRSTFTGLEVVGDGSLQYYVNGTAVGSPEAYGGTFSDYVGSLYKLTYSIDTSTGAISNVSFGSSTTAYSFTPSGSFVNGDTANLEIGGQASDNSDTAAISNLSLTTEGSQAVPEPSTYALLASGALLLGAHQLRRRRNEV